MKHLVLNCLLQGYVALHAGVVHGVVLERASGLPLARTRVELQPISKSDADLRPIQTQTSTTGHYDFGQVPDGLYVLTARRDFYYPVAYGQRSIAGHGKPFLVSQTSELFAELQMFRKGTITGRVLDENGIGVPDVGVVAYRARLPLRPLGRGVSDDRGVYRIPDLDAGDYWVRSTEHVFPDGKDLLPTFGREASETSDAYHYSTGADRETAAADIRPISGSLFHLSGKLVCLAGLVTLTLSSETGRTSIQAPCQSRYRFAGLAPGPYEVLARLPDGNAGFLELNLDHNIETGDVQLLEPPLVEFVVQQDGSSPPAEIPLQLIGRRLDVSGPDEVRVLTMPSKDLAPGRWELAARINSGRYVASIKNESATARSRITNTRTSSDWFPVFIGQRDRVRIIVTISDATARITGHVLHEGKTVPGAPVFLWPIQEAARRSLNGARTMLTDTAGAFHFEDLPPGPYRLLATFDIGDVDEESVELTRAPTVDADSGKTSDIKLGLWIAP